jgi:hypothetical protein
LILVASASSLAQKASASPTPQDAEVVCKLCPTVSVSCPSDVEVGKPIEFKVSVGNFDPNTVPTYTWEVVGGEIAEGQGTPAIKVNTGSARPVTATVTVSGLDPSCSKTASCSTAIANRSFLAPAKKFDSYSVIPINKERAILDLFAAALKQAPGARGHILGYRGRLSRVGAAQKSVDRAKEYLVNKLGIDERRIVTLDGGIKEERTVDLWLVPTGSIPPAAEPTIDPAEVKVIKTMVQNRAKISIRR